WHLVAFILVFLGLVIYLVVTRYKEMPISKKDEETYSREFWMFVGAIFLGLSCFHLVLVTSIPVWNRMFGTKVAPPTDLVGHYNIIQASFAMVITLLITVPVYYFSGLYKLHFFFQLVMLGAVYSLLVNGKMLIDDFKGKFKLA